MSENSLPDNKNGKRRNTRHTRRTYLKRIGTVAVATSAFATSGSADDNRQGRSNAPHHWEPPADEPIDRDAMTDRYIDPPDGADLADYVEDSRSGEKLVVAPGDYRWTRQVVHDWNDWGLQGDPDAPGEVTIWLEDGWGFYDERDFPDSLGLLINSNGGSNLLVENLHLDSEGRTSPGFRFTPGLGDADDGGVLAHRIIDHAPGTTEMGRPPGGTETFLLHIGEESHVMVEGCCQHQRGSIAYDNTSQTFLFNAGPGELTVRRCKASGMSDNIIYTRMPGPMTVENCVFANTTPSAIRVGGENEVVRNCTFWLDTDDRELYNRDGVVNTRAIGASGSAGHGGYVENCSFICESTPHTSGIVATVLPNEWLEITDSQFLINQDINGIYMPDATVTIKDTEFVTTAASGATVGAAGTFNTTNVGVDPELDPGAIDPDYEDVSFDWDEAHAFPDPQLASAYVPVGEELPGRGPPHRPGRRQPPW